MTEAAADLLFHYHKYTKTYKILISWQQYVLKMTIQTKCYNYRQIEDKVSSIQ